MTESTRQLWAKQDQHSGDRLRLFTAIEQAFSVETVLYPGSYVDVAPSFVFDDTTYLDMDRRATRFFGDEAGVSEIIDLHRTSPGEPKWRFIEADYTSPLDLPTDHFDLLVSLYAGLVSEYCTRFLRPGGLLLVNPSHGDAAMASIDPRYGLVAVVQSRSSQYTVSTDHLDTYLQPKRPTEITHDLLHRSGRGIAYTKPAFAYVFRHNG